MARICPVCGKREIGPRATMCKQCNVKQNREYYVSHGICPRCKKQRLYNGEWACIECRALESERFRRRYHENADFRERVLRTSNERHLRQWENRKNEGICGVCGRRKAAKGHSLCEVCMISKRNKQRMDIPRSERVSYGMCYICGEPLDREGRSCTKCATECASRLRRNPNKMWRRSNELMFGRKKDETQV